MKAFWMDSENTIYAAKTAAKAAQLYESSHDEPLDPAYPQELTDDELDTPQIKHDAAGQPTKERVSVREYLTAATEPGFLCGMFL